jgi:hypothetical protein
MRCYQERRGAKLRGWLVVHDRERPAPAGEFTRDRDVSDDGSFTAFVEPDPAFVQASVPVVSAGPGWGVASSQRARIVAPGV